MDDVKRLCDRLEASAIVASPLGRAAMREAATALTLAQARIRELETALAARSAEPVAWPDVYRVRAHGNWLYFTDAETAHGSAEMHGTVAHPLYAHPAPKESPDV